MSVSDHVLKSLGKIAVNFQFMETILVAYISELIGPDHTVGQIVATQLPFGRLCIVVKALFDYKITDVQARERFAALVAQAGELEERRNQYFHSAWGSDHETGTRVRIKAKVGRRNELAVSMPEVTDEELDQVNQQLRECAIGLTSFGRQIGLFRTEQ